MTDAALPLAIYVHLPWCVRKCPYCDFNSFTASAEPPKARYLRALARDLERQSPLAGRRSVGSVFLGGGTPSFFSPDEIAFLLGEVRKHFNLDDDVEITMEANPSSVESGDPEGYLRAGVNRLSVGAQSFNEDHLRTLGRLHDVADIRRAVADARAAGFDNINLDIMYALPEQSADEAMSDLDAAFALDPEHISWYQLTLEPNTVFHARPPRGLPDDERIWAIQEAGQRRLHEQDYRQYEISAYAKPGRECGHNLNYWRFGDYLAFGAGAHGKISRNAAIERYVRPGNPEAFMRSVEKDEPLRMAGVSPADRQFEFMLMALRLNEGFTADRFKLATGLSAGALAENLAAAIDRGLMEMSGPGAWRATEIGRRFLNDLQATFLPEEAFDRAGDGTA